MHLVSLKVELATVGVVDARHGAVLIAVVGADKELDNTDQCMTSADARYTIEVCSLAKAE